MLSYEISELYSDPLYQRRLVEAGTRTEVLAWASWAEPHGSFLDMDRDAADLPRLTREEAIEAIWDHLDTRARYRAPDYKTLRVSSEGSPLLGGHVARLSVPEALQKLESFRRDASIMGGSCWSNARADVVELPLADGERMQHVIRWL